MVYRTKTYIAADWDGDSNAVEQLKKWNDSEKWSLSFTDVHEAAQSSDDSLNCSIKASLAKRMDISKTFVLIVGSGTKSRRSGECTYCTNFGNGKCKTGHTVSNDSFIEYECKKAVRDSENIKLVVLYNAATVDKSKCPDAIKAYSTHAPMQKMQDGKHYWDYQSVKEAMGQ
jgi:hypothetical protein